jgi:fructose-bisphosphate aldolase class II
MEQLLGLFQGATEARAPFILAFSRAARAYARPRMLEAMTRAAHDLFPDAVLAVHLDHGDEATCYDAIDSGFYTSVMIDGSHLPFDDNVALTRRVAQRAHAQGLSVEAELGVLKGVEDDLNVDQSLLTDPDQAAEFVQRTACDSLAVAVGTSHGAYKFSGPENLRLDRLKAIQTRLPGFPLVLHGASSVDLREVERINGAGGAMPTTAKGVDEQILSEAIRRGVTKVNIATDGRLLWTRVHREFFRDRPEAFDPAEPGRAFMQAFAQLVAHKCTVLRSAGRLESISKQLSVSDPQGL